MKKHLTYLTLLLFCCLGTVSTVQAGIIPHPQSVTWKNGEFKPGVQPKVYTNQTGKEKALLLDYLKSSPLQAVEAENAEAANAINLIIKDDTTAFPSAESYRLEITPTGITITARGGAGLFYGVQSLLQLAEGRQGAYTFPAVLVNDTPRFAYRGMHLDVSRNFFDKEFVKKQLRMMAHYKLNRFHWHLTDGAGWRLEIKKYPKLTQIAAWRPYQTWSEWQEGGHRYCSKNDPNAHGGYYTKKDVQEVLALAEQLHITVIPEIEMPGHSEEVLAVYPELSCSGVPYENSDFCIGNEKTFKFVENVLKEVMEMFPSEYIHIGGDEASKAGWKTCPKCKKRMEKEGLKNVDELQSYMIHRVEAFLNKHGRKLLGWDEILEGGLAPNATVMSWRGEQGGIAAAKAGHQVVMTPGAYCYFDSYQADPETQPEAFGGVLPIRKVYSYNPVPASLTLEEGKLVMGVQANVWAERIPTPEHCEYMIYPRILALSEVAWTQPENKFWPDFKKRVSEAIPYLQSQGYNPYTLSDDVTLEQEADLQKKCIRVTLSSEKTPVEIRYSIDGTEPTSNSLLYDNPFEIQGTAVVSARVFIGGKPVGRILTKRIDYHKAIGKSITYNKPYSPSYPAAGEATLLDGVKGGETYGDGRWQGFIDGGFDVTVDLGEVMPLHYINADFMSNKGPQVYLPLYVEIFTSNDGKDFTLLKKIDFDPVMEAKKATVAPYSWTGDAQGRYVRYVAHVNPETRGWLFADELVIQ